MNPNKIGGNVMGYRDYSYKWGKCLVGKFFGDGYGGIYRDQRWIRNIIKPIVKLIKRYPKDANVFLADMGCGSGIIGLSALQYLLPEYNNVFLHSIDVNINQLDGIEDEAKKLKITGNYQAVNSSLFNIAYPDNFFSGVMGRLFLHHLTPEDNNRFWQFVVSKLQLGGVASIYTIVAQNETIVHFIYTVYKWRAKKVGVNPQGFIPTSTYIEEKLTVIKGIGFKIYKEVKGPLYVNGEASIQEKSGLREKEMDGLEKIFQFAPSEVRKLCRIEIVSHFGQNGKINTHRFYWPCQLIIIRKEIKNG